MIEVHGFKVELIDKSHCLKAEYPFRVFPLSVCVDALRADVSLFVSLS